MVTKRKPPAGGQEPAKGPKLDADIIPSPVLPSNNGNTVVEPDNLLWICRHCNKAYPAEKVDRGVCKNCQALPGICIHCSRVNTLAELDDDYVCADCDLTPDQRAILQKLHSSEHYEERVQEELWKAGVAEGQRGQRGSELPDAGEPLSAYVVSLADADPTAPAALLSRSDSESLLYQSKVNWVYAASGSGKSWLAIYILNEAHRRGQRAVFWDHEMNPGQVRGRNKALDFGLEQAEREGTFLYL